MLRGITVDASPDDIIGVKIEAENDSCKAIGSSYRPINQLSAQMILDLLDSVSQSNSVFSVSDRLIITATIISLPDGGAIVKLSHCSDWQILQPKADCIVHVGVSNDNLCLPKAILIGKAYLQSTTMRLLNTWLNPANYNLLNELARDITNRAGVDLNIIDCNLFSIYKFQKLFPEYTIVVYDEKRNSGNKYVLKAQGTGGYNKVINLFYLKELKHFVYIKSRLQFFGQLNECDNCFFLYKGNAHLCKKKCLQCRGRYVCIKTNTQSCAISITSVTMGQVKVYVKI